MKFCPQKQFRRLQKCSHGFSLAELLLVVAVLAILASLGLAMVGNTTSGARIAAAKRKAHDIVSVYTAGLYAGAPSFVAAKNMDEARNAVGKGDNGGGALSTMYFHLRGVSDKMDEGFSGREKSSYYLSWENGVLIYNPGGNK